MHVSSKIWILCSLDRQTYSSVWPKLLNIYPFLWWIFFSYSFTSWKWYCLTFWTGKKSRLFRRFFQYSVICNFSVSFKKFTKGNARKFTVSFAFCAHVDIIKIEKHWCFPFSACNGKTIGRYLNYAGRKNHSDNRMVNFLYDYKLSKE